MRKTLSLLLAVLMLLSLSVVSYADQQTLTASADGRNGPIEVEVVA